MRRLLRLLYGCWPSGAVQSKAPIGQPASKALAVFTSDDSCASEPERRMQLAVAEPRSCLSHAVARWVDTSSCGSYLSTNLGVTPLQIVLTALVIFNVLSVLPSDPRRSDLELHVWLQGGCGVEAPREVQVNAGSMPFTTSHCHLPSPHFHPSPIPRLCMDGGRRAAQGGGPPSGAGRAALLPGNRHQAAGVELGGCLLSFCSLLVCKHACADFAACAQAIRLLVWSWAGAAIHCWFESMPAQTLLLVSRPSSCWPGAGRVAAQLLIAASYR